MTSDEIKRTYSMTEIVSRYGLKPNKAGFAPCPFHKEKTASMKIYKDSYHCFGCGENGDIFTFVQRMDDLTFKEAFQSLGGTYERDGFQSNLAKYKAMKARETREKKRGRLEQRRKLNNQLILLYSSTMRKTEPFSDVWRDCCNALTYQIYVQECLDRREVVSCKK